MSAVLTLDHMTANYKVNIDGLRDLSLNVDAGRINDLIGLNGAEKSTVMKAICSFLKPNPEQ